MKTVCAWCGVLIKPETPESEQQGVISHGLCKACKFHLFAEMGMPLGKYLDGLGGPIVVIGQDVTVMMANRQACELLHKDLSAMEGFRPGSVFECAYSYLPEGCGQTVHCSGCTIRRAVTETLKSGKGVTRKPAFVRFRSAQDGHMTEMWITTELVGGVVLLRIDGAETLSPVAS